MIKFRPKTLVQDLMPEAIKRLDEQGISYNKISSKEADTISKVNSKAMVLVSFTKNDRGYFEIQFQSKEVYGYVKKLLGEVFRMRITNIDTPKRIITAETDFIGIALDIIEVLGLDPHFNLSLVYDKV
jgi:hypothetical protein